MAEQITYLIIGNGIAGVTAAEVLRAEERSASIGVIADDPFPVYYRPALKDYLSGRVHEDKLWARPSSFYQDQNVLFLSDRVATIQAQQHCVTLESGKQVGYSKLLLATGASAARLSCPGSNLRGVWTLRTISDYQEILERLSIVRRVVITGSGTLALETAETLRHRGFQVTHLIRRNTLWSEVLDATASDLVLQQERRDGIDVRLEEEIVEITGTRGEVSGVVTSQGSRIPCEMVLAAIGVEPNIDFIRASGIQCWRGVRVDDMMRTAAVDVYAAGDVLETTNPVTGRTRVIGQWYPAIQQARAAAYSMLDLLDSDESSGGATFACSNFYNATFLYGLDFASVGLTNATAKDGYQELVADPQPRTYRKVLLKGDIPVGALALGGRKQVLAFKRAIDHRVSLASVASRIFAPDFDLSAWLDEQGVPSPLLAVRRRGEAAVRQTASMKLQSIQKTQKTQAIKKVSPQTRKTGEREKPMARSVPAGRQEALLVQVVKADQQLRFPETLISQTAVFTIGRQAGVYLLIDEASVSRRHAEISYTGDMYVLRDLGSTNGTFVNSTRLDPERPYVLQANDLVRFGNVVAFKFLQRVLAVGQQQEPTKPAPANVVSSREPVVQGQAVLNPDGSLQPPGTTRLLSASVVARFKETPTLIIMPDKGAGAETGSQPRIYQLRSNKRVSIGREAGCDITLADAVVSRHHAEIFFGPDGFYIRDLGSSNGVYVNSTRLTNPYQLNHGDRIRLGSTMIYFVDLQAGTQRTIEAPALPRIPAPRTPEAAPAPLVENQPGDQRVNQEITVRQAVPVPANTGEIPTVRRTVPLQGNTGEVPTVRRTVPLQGNTGEIPTVRRTVPLQGNTGQVPTVRQVNPIQATVRTPEVMICPRCGVANMRVARFCASCSAPLAPLSS